MKLLTKAFLPKGFLAAAVCAGIKQSGKPDLALISSSVPCRVSAMFTSNRIPAAPVVVCKDNLKAGRGIRAIVANSGNANCFNGAQGIKDARSMCCSAARALGVKEKEVLVASTGIIGKRMPAGLVNAAMPSLVTGLSAQGIKGAARAIMTTDKFTKEATSRFTVGNKTVTVCGIAKGAGMIAPDMATMLAFVFTDAAIGEKALASSLKSSVEQSYNCVTVDGCMSTNDTVILMANAAAGNPVIKGGKELELFRKALDAVNLRLAKMMVEDGEGASKFIEIRVRAAKTRADAKKAALAVANSNLFKTAVYGENPNFGRIAAAVGASGVDIDEKRLTIRLGTLNGRKVKVEIGLSSGKEQCVVYTSDLTPEYLKINAAYN
jgi:glutamate N-acetyltransferase/amino-acid N-acetyltransferase